MSAPTTIWFRPQVASSFSEGETAAPAPVRTDQIKLDWVTTHSSDPHVSVEMIEGIPASFVEMYAAMAVRHGRVSQLEDGAWFADVVGLDGAWGEGASAAEALDELQIAIHGWVAVKLRIGAPVPPIDGLDLNRSSV